MISIPKLIVLALIIGAVWYGFKVFGRGRAIDEPERRDNVGRNETGAVDMTKCSVCGDFVPSGSATDCGRDGCPFPPG